MGHLKTRRLSATLAAVALAIGLAVGLGATAASAQSTSNIYNSNSARCLGIADNNAGIWNCTDAGNADQAWYWKGIYITGPDRIVYGMIENKKGQCLGVAGGSTASGARIVDGPASLAITISTGITTACTTASVDRAACWLTSRHRSTASPLAGR